VVGDPQVLGLLEEMLDSGKTPEEVCRDCPDLLPEVRRRWEDFCRVDAELGALLPGLRTRPDGPVAPAPPAAGLPHVPGYEVEALLGRGGMGVVYRARHLALKRDVALKMLAGGHAAPADRSRFRAEAEAVARLQHPNIVQIYEVGDAGGLPYIALELVEGGSLAERLAGRPLPPREAARLVAALAEGMHLAHSRNLIHRDLKPGNVLLAGVAGAPVDQCQPKVTDFGLVRQTDADSGKTRVGVVMGTPSYMAPEQAEGRAHAAGPPADVYALGAILYECLTGRPPFQGATPLETLEQVRTREPAAPSALRHGVPRDLETICLKCLRKPPERRYSSAREMADDLGRFARGEPVAARPVGVAERVRKWALRRPAVAGLLAAVTLLTSAGGGGIWLLSQQRAVARGRQAQTDLEVLGILQRAQAKLMTGWDAHDLATLTEARIESDQAAGVAQGGGASPEVRQKAEAFQRDAAGRQERARKNRELMEAALDITTVESASYKSGAGGALVNKSADEQYAAAFSRWGLDVDRATDAEVIARLGAEPDVVVQELIAALDNWTQARRRPDRVSADWERLYRLAGQMDRSERRRRLRGLLVGRIAPRPEGLVGAVGAASPWLALWELTGGGARRQLQAVLGETDPSSELVQALVMSADACQAQGDLAGAEQVLRRALAARPDHIVLIVRLAKLLERWGPPRFSEAVVYFRAAYALNPNMSKSLCYALNRMGRYEESEEFNREMIRRQPDNVEFHRMLCAGLIAQEKYRPLEEASLKFIDRNPNLAQAHNAYGVALAGQRRFAEAEKAYRKALALDPNDAWVHNNLGPVLVELGKYEEASVVYRKALKLKSEFQLVYVNLGALLMRQQRFDEALATYRKAVEVLPDALAYTGLGSCLANHFQDNEGAEAAFRKAVALRPDFMLANYSLGYVLLKQGKHAEAADVFRQLLRRSSKDVSTTRLFCFALMGLGREQEARVAWRQMLDANPGDHQAWSGYPEMCHFLGQDEEYRRVRTAYLKRFAGSTDPVVAYRTARACLLLPCADDELQTAGALAEVATASRRPEHEWLRPYILFTQGLADYRRGRWDSTIALMEGEASGLGGPAPNLIVAMARFRQGRTDDAWKAFATAVVAFDWSVHRSFDPDAWIYHGLRREAEAMILSNLSAYIQGAYRPQQENERLALLAARLADCEVRGLYGAAARLCVDLFLAEPKLVGPLANGSRFCAARVAALVGCGKGKDADQLDDKERVLWRRQALEWLRQEVSAWSKVAGKSDPKAKDLLRSRMRSWQADPDLAGVRAKDELARLPDEEREQWERLWSDAGALLRRASDPD
jgi:eukaryotic-like serine/threonine-protein kinase